MTKKPCKIWNSKREKKISMTVSTFQELVERGSQKLGLQGQNVTVVLEDDGCEVDEEDYFSFLPDDTIFMFLEGSVKWTSAANSSTHTDDTDSVVFESDVPENDISRLLPEMQSNPTKIALLTEDQLQEIVELEPEQLACYFNNNIRFASSFQDGCQRHLDHRQESRDANALLELYHNMQSNGAKRKRP